jgi:TonB family protein
MYKATIVYLAFLFIFSNSCAPKIGYGEEYESKIQELSKAYDFFKNKNYEKAIIALKDFHEKYDSNYYDYETVALLSDCYYNTGASIDGANNYLFAINELKTYIDTTKKKVTYQNLALNDLEKWYSNYPMFPEELKSFNSRDELPQPIKGLVEFQNRIRYNFEKSGRIILNALIDESGNVLDIVVLKSFSEEAAINSMKALKNTKFTIPKRKGRIAKTWIAIPISFK